jgi:hypothetical protein
MAPEVSEAKALRLWARAQGFQVSDRGLLPESLRDQWVNAGAPWPDGSTKPQDWSPSDRPRNKPRANGRVRATSTAPMGPTPGGAGSFAQPSPPTRLELGLDPLVVELVAGGTAEVMTQQEADWFNGTKSLYMEQNRFEDISDLQDLDRLLLLELLMHRWAKWLLSGSDYNGNWVDGAELGKQLKDRNAAITTLKDGMGLSKKSRDASAAGVSERWNDILKRARLFNYHRVDQVRVALLLMNQISAAVGTFYRSDEEERRRTGFKTEAEIVEWVRDDLLPKFAEVDDYFRENEQSTWRRG